MQQTEAKQNIQTKVERTELVNMSQCAVKAFKLELVCYDVKRKLLLMYVYLRIMCVPQLFIRMFVWEIKLWFAFERYQKIIL